MAFAHIALACLALAAPASSITDYVAQIYKEPGTTYQLWRYSQVGTRTTQLSGGGHFSSATPVMETRELDAGCYGIATGPPTEGDFSLTLIGTTNKTVGPSDSFYFSRGGAFCGLGTVYDDCMAHRTGVPAVTCRNAAEVLSTECGFATTDAAYKAVVGDCAPNDIKPMTLYLVFKPNVDASGTFKADLLAALATLLDLYPDAFGDVTITKHDGFDVVAIEFSAYLAAEVQDILLRLTQKNLERLITMVPGLAGTVLEAFGSDDAQGADATIPGPVQTVIDTLSKRCEDGSEPVAGKCDDGSTPEVPAPTPAPAPAPVPTPPPTPASVSDDDEHATHGDDDSSTSTSTSSSEATCKKGTSGSNCVLECKNGAKPNKAGMCIETPAGGDDDTNGASTSGSKDDKGGLSGGEKAGIAFAAIFGCALLCAGGAHLMKKRRQRALATAAKQKSAGAGAVPMA